MEWNLRCCRLVFRSKTSLGQQRFTCSLTLTTSWMVRPYRVLGSLTSNSPTHSDVFITKNTLRKYPVRMPTASQVILLDVRLHISVRTSIYHHETGQNSLLRKPYLLIRYDFRISSDAIRITNAVEITNQLHGADFFLAT